MRPGAKAVARSSAAGAPETGTAIRPGRTTLFLAAGSASSIAFLSGSAILSARALGPDLRGELAVQLVFAAMALAVTGSGVALAGRVLLVHSSDRLALTSYLGLMLVVSAASFVLAALLGPPILRHADVRLDSQGTMALATYTGVLVAGAISISALAAYGLLRRAALADVAGSATGLAATAGLYLAGSDAAHHYLLALAIGAAVQVMVAMVMLRHAGMGLRPTADRVAWRRIARLGVEGSGFTLAQSAAYRFDRYLVGALISSSAAGSYAVAATTTEIIRLGPWAAGQVILYRHASRTDDETQGRRMRAAGLVLTAVAAIAVAATAHLTVPLVFGQEYERAVAPLRLLVFGEIALCSYVMDMGALLGRGRIATAGAVTMCGVVLGIAIDVVLIPQHGLPGAAVGSVVSYAVMALVARLVVRRMA